MVHAIYLFLFCVSGALAANSPILRCRTCVNAKDLGDCTTVTNCDASAEVCQAASSGSGIGKRQSLISCSRCCNSSDLCNAKLCGITQSNLSQCQFCDVTNGFLNVTNPTQCTTITTCSPNEVCIASQSVSNGRVVNTYGCQRLVMCKLLMMRSLQHYKICTSKTTTPPVGYTVDEYCGSAHLIGRRSVLQCQVCCGDSMCNHGTCTEITARLAALEEQGKLDMVTLKEKI